ncbi:MAG: acetate--CoA ligase family protein [Spirochaetes bacterium]|nr:acetate--CoA ligase family protein [Spirochaetota bacterium]
MALSKENIAEIDSIMDRAYSENRNTLYEFEVYEILNSIGLEVPKFSYVRSIGEVTEELLSEYGNEIIIKIVSSEISHKQKLGGVKKVANNDPLFIQFVLSRMQEEVLSHFPENEKPKLDGFLIVECIQFREALGYEVLFGFKEDTGFGPVLTVTKGGDDAEFFAKYYDPANLLIPPISLEMGTKLANQLKIRHKFKQVGHPEYMDMMAEAIAKVSELATHYSFIAKEKPSYLFTSMDINPMVFTKDHRFLVLDGFAEFIKTEDSTNQLPDVNTKNIDAFFNPKGIAVIGVSGDTSKYSLGRDVAQLLHDLDRDDLYLVNNKGGNLTLGDKNYTFYESVQDIKENVDLVVYTAPAKFTLSFFDELKSTSVKSVILISGIPAEIKYTEFAQQLDKHVPEGVRVIGPNCMGVFYAPGEDHLGLNTLFIEQKRLEIGYNQLSNTVLLTQSGALAVTEIDKLKYAKIFKSIVSFGNKYDVKISDLMAYFNEVPHVDVISLYIEGFDPGEGRQFFQLAGKINKPIIAYKSGRTEAGAKAAASHTASMTGDYEVFKAACQQSGVILAEDIEDHYDYLKVFSKMAKKKPKGLRVAGVVNAGFEATVGADAMNNLKQAVLSESTIGKIKEIDKYGLVDFHTSFLDITPMADDRMYAGFTEAVLEDENVDCVFVAIVPHTVTLKTIPETCHDLDSLANLLVELNKKSDKPIVVSVNAGRYYQEFMTILEENGIPVYSDIRQAIKSLDAFATHYVNKG